jgi:plasmid maintenance system antidote protein VapI
MTRKTSKATESSSEVAAKVIAATKAKRPSAKDRVNGRGNPPTKATAAQLQEDAAADPSTPVTRKPLTGKAKVEYDKRVAAQRGSTTAKKTAAATKATTTKKTAAKKTATATTATKKTAAKKTAAATPLAQTRHLPHATKSKVSHPGPIWHAVLKEKGLSQAQAADLMGVAPMTLNRFLNGHGIPSCKVTIAFARAVGQDIHETWMQVAEYELALTLERGV